MQIIKEQLRSINHFLIILIPLFIINALFNLKYDWGGVSVIARVYIMVISFYIIFIFSQINVDEYRADYTSRYGWKGNYFLFIVLKFFPFLFIYFLTIVFTLINYLGYKNWPLEPAYRLLDGRYSNTVIYGLILFVILKLKKKPGISIPLFIICAIIYFVADHQLYSLFEPGIGVSIIKLTKYFIFIFALVYGFSRSRWMLLESILLSIITGLVLFASVASFFTLSFFMSPPGSPSLSITGRILLKSGFVFPLDKLQKNVLQYGTPMDTENIFLYIEKYKKETGYTAEEWEKLIFKNKIENIKYIFSHLNDRKIKLDFEILKTYAITQFSTSPSDPSTLEQFHRYFGSYYTGNKKEFYELYKSGSEPMKIEILKSLAYTDDIDAVNFLTDKITSVERLRAEAAYNTLKKITKEDPAADLKINTYDIKVVLFFREFASRMKIDKK